MRSLRLERTYPHSRDTVWAAITDGSVLERWLGARGFHARVGRDFTVQAPPGPGFDGQVRCRVVALVAPHTLAFSWKGGPVDTVVTLHLEQTGSETRMTLEQTGFQSHHALLVPALELWWAEHLDRRWITVAALTTSGGVFGTSSTAISAIVGAIALGTIGLVCSGVLPSSSAPEGPDGPASIEPHATAERRSADRAGPIDVDATQPTPTATASTWEGGPDHAPGDAMIAGSGSPAELTVYDELPTTMNPLFARTAADDRMQELVFDRLFFTHEGRWQSRLVPKFQVAGDRRSVTIELLEDVAFHDEHVLDAEDLCFTVRTLLDPEVPSAPSRRYRSALEGCSAAGLQATIRFSHPVPDPREYLDFAVLPAHHPGLRSPDDSFSTRPVGTGPMKAALGRRSVQFTVAPNAHRDTRIEKLTVQEMGDPLVAVRTFLNGGVDGLVRVRPALVDELTSAGARPIRWDSNEVWFFQMNTEHGPLADGVTRQAVHAALDRGELGKLTFGPEVISPRAGVFDRLGAGDEPTDDRRDAHLTLAISPEDRTPSYGLMDLMAGQLRAAGFTTETVETASVSPTAVDLWIGRVTARDDRDLADRLLNRGSPTNPFRHDGTALVAALDAATTHGERSSAQAAITAHLRTERPVVLLWDVHETTVWNSKLGQLRVAPYWYYSSIDDWGP